jgi:hypothetical protein
MRFVRLYDDERSLDHGRDMRGVRKPQHRRPVDDHMVIMVAKRFEQPREAGSGKELSGVRRLRPRGNDVQMFSVGRLNDPFEPAVLRQQIGEAGLLGKSERVVQRGPPKVPIDQKDRACSRLLVTSSEWGVPLSEESCIEASTL